MGIEFREGSMVIANKTNIPAKKGIIHFTFVHDFSILVCPVRSTLTLCSTFRNGLQRKRWIYWIRKQGNKRQSF